MESFSEMCKSCQIVPQSIMMCKSVFHLDTVLTSQYLPLKCCAIEKKVKSSSLLMLCFGLVMNGNRTADGLHNNCSIYLLAHHTGVYKLDSWLGINKLLGFDALVNHFQALLQPSTTQHSPTTQIWMLNNSTIPQKWSKSS